MGSKTAARACAMAAGAPGRARHRDTDRRPTCAMPRSSALPMRVGYPLMVKAVAGGGGKGMREVRSGDTLLDAVRRARSEALGAFGDAAVYFERRVARPRHVEIQLLADQHGTVLPFVERECSVQRRHQKVIEESPAPRMSLALRHRMAEAGSVGRARRRLHQRRHDRVPGGRRRRVLFPGDEHPAAGGASGHGDGDRRRPGAVADPHRPRRAPHRRRPTRRSRRADTRSSAASTPRIRISASCLVPGGSPR